MCTLFILINQIPEIPFALIANRDEFYARPTLPLQGFDLSFSGTGDEIFAPKDQTHGGTWFGYRNSKDHKFAILTNIRDLRSKKDSTKSRGEIVKHFLQSDKNPSAFISDLKKMSSDYNGFNLIFGNHRDCFHFHSKTKKLTFLWHHTSTTKKTYGLSNSRLNCNWPKVKNTRQKISRYFKEKDSHTYSIEQHWNFLKEQMQNQEKYSPSVLPHTGVSKEIEILLSSPFIQSETYGTRSTLFFGMKNETITLFEQAYDSLGKESAFFHKVLSS